MTQQFSFILKDTTQKAFNSFYWFLYFVHVIAGAAILLRAADGYHKNAAWVFISLLSLLKFSYPYFKGKIKSLTYQRLVALTMIVFWLVLQAWVPAIVLISAVVFSDFVLSIKTKAVFSNDNIIVVKSLFNKAYSWAEVENVVLKDHLLTVDFKNNRLLQVEISTESFMIDEVSFNQFCIHQLQSPNS